MATVRDVERVTGKKLALIIDSQKKGTNKDLLAHLKRGVGRLPGEDPMLWGLIFDGLSDDMYSVCGEPSWSEWAIYIALTLYAQHQGNKPVNEICMHKPGMSFGEAVAMLVKDPNEENRIGYKVKTTARSSDIYELSYEIRRVVEFLKKESIPLDYIKLAGDIFKFQIPECTESVRMRWGEDFAKNAGKNYGEKEEKKTEHNRENEQHES